MTRQLAFVLCGMSIFLGTIVALAHDDDPRVSVELETKSFGPGTAELSFELVDIKDRILLTDRELATVHEKKLHVFILDPALKEFRHEHAIFEGRLWKVSTRLDRDAKYWLWVQGTIAKDAVEFTASERFSLSGGLPQNPLPPILGEARSGSDRLSKVALSNEKVTAEKMAMLTLSFSRTDGTEPGITPYLGEKAHVIGVLEDGDTLMHIHPMDHGEKNQLMLHMKIKNPGQYRLWVQFIDDKILRTIPLSIVVQKKGT